MSRFDFDKVLERRVEQAEKRDAKTSPPTPLMRDTIDPKRTRVFDAIQVWIRAWYAAASSPLKGIDRVIVDPPQYQLSKLSPAEAANVEVREHEAAQPRRHEVLPPDDPFGVLSASRFELLQRLLNHLRPGERAAVEAELARRNREQPIPYDENEAAVLRRGRRDE